MKVAPSWTTNENSTMDVTDVVNKVDAGTYTCTNLTDVSVRYEVSCLLLLVVNSYFRLWVAMEDTAHMATSRTTTTSTNTSNTGMDITALTQQHTTLMKTFHTEESEEVSTPLAFLLEAQTLTLVLARALPTLALPIPDHRVHPQCLLGKKLMSNQSLFF